MRSKKRSAVIALMLAVLLVFTGMPVNAFAAGKTKVPDFKSRTVYVRKGAKKKLTFSPKNNKAKYKWSTANKKVASVNQKGYVRGVKTGKTKISVRVTLPKTNAVTRRVNIKVCDKITVTTGSAVSTIVKRNAYNQITIRTDEKTTISIPAGNYKNTDLIVDAPNADITNLGVFKSITINGIADDTWHEMANGNSIVFNAPVGRIVIPKDSQLNQLVLSSQGKNLKLEVEGTVGAIDVNSESKVDMHVTGTVGQINVNSKSDVAIKGSTTASIPVVTSADSTGSTISSEVKVDVTSESDAKISLSKGAEGSTIKSDSQTAKVEVVNDTVFPVNVQKSTGENVSITTGQTVDTSTMKVENTPAAPTPGDTSGNNSGSNTGATGTTPAATGTTPAPTPSTTGGTTGGSTSGGSSSQSGSTSGGTTSGGSTAGSTTSGGSSTNHPTATGDASRVITSVEAIKDRYAIDYVRSDSGVAYLSLEDIKKNLPEKVVGYYDRDGKKQSYYRVSLGEWTNVNNYPESGTPEPGDYTFTAPVIVSKGYTVAKSGVMASVIVKVEKPVITKFDAIQGIKGGIEGTKLKSADKLCEKLEKTTVYASLTYKNEYGYENTGRTSFKIKSLIAPDNYKTDASESKAGDYAFTAALDSPIEQFDVADVVSATVPVHVTKNEEIEYTRYVDEQYKNFKVTSSYEIEGSNKFVVFIQYNGTEDTNAYLSICYYNEDGYMIDTTNSNVGYVPFTRGKEIGFVFNLPRNRDNSYKCFDLNLSVSKLDNQNGSTDGKDLTVSKPEIICCTYDKGEKEIALNEASGRDRRYKGRFAIKNNSTATISSISYVAYFWSADGILLYEEDGHNVNNIYGGEEMIFDAEYSSPYRNDPGYGWFNYDDKEVPDHVTIEINKISILGD